MEEGWFDEELSGLALVSAIQISCSPCLAFAWLDFGR